MKTIIKICLLASIFVTTGAYATVDLIDVYQKALENDPTFQSAGAQRLSERQAIGQARAALLPNINAQGSPAQSYQKNGGTALRPAGTHNFSDETYTVTVSQALFRFSDWMRYAQAKAVGSQADANYEAAKQDLIVRVAEAYFNVLEAQDILRFTSAEKRANKRQLDQAKERHSVGLDAITSVYDAQAAYDAVAAREITAENDVTNARESLRAITNVYYKKLARLIKRLPLVPPQPSNVEIWTSRANHFNSTLAAARFASKAAKEGMRAAFAGHFPNIDMTGTYEKQKRGDAGLGGLDLETRSVGLDVSLPIYQGGLIFSQTKQARFDYLAAMSDMEGAYRSAIDSTRQSYNNIISGISTIKADRQAIISSQKSLESTEAALNVGTRTIVDLLDAQQNLFDSQRQLSSDQYAYINSILALKQAAGTLNENDVVQINRWLRTRRHYPKCCTSKHIFSKKAKRTRVAAIKKSRRINKSGATFASKTKPTTKTKLAKRAKPAGRHQKLATTKKPKMATKSKMANRATATNRAKLAVGTANKSKSRLTPKVAPATPAKKTPAQLARHLKRSPVRRHKAPRVNYGNKLGQVHTAKPVYVKPYRSKQAATRLPQRHRAAAAAAVQPALNSAKSSSRGTTTSARRVLKQRQLPRPLVSKALPNKLRASKASVAKARVSKHQRVKSLPSKPSQHYLPPVPLIKQAPTAPHRRAYKAKPWQQPKADKVDDDFGFAPRHSQRQQKANHKAKPRASRRHVTGEFQVSENTRGDYINSLEYYATPRHPSSTR